MVLVLTLCDVICENDVKWRRKQYLIPSIHIKIFCFNKAVNHKVGQFWIAEIWYYQNIKDERCGKLGQFCRSWLWSFMAMLKELIKWTFILKLHADILLVSTWDYFNERIGLITWRFSTYTEKANYRRA